jgi:DNA-binding NarL/FixJ family response regulator
MLNQSRKYSVVIVDDHELYPIALQKIITESDFLEYKATFNSGEVLISNMDRLRPDVIFMDIKMSGMDGFAASRAVLKKYPTTQIIATSLYADGEYVNRMFKIGAKAYITKDSSILEFRQLFDCIKEGKKFVSSNAAVQYTLFTNRDRDKMEPNVAPGSIARENPMIQHFGLTDGEAIVMLHVAVGLPDKQIASKLGVSIRTINAHKRNIRDKTGTRNSTEVAILAFKCGMIK